VVVRSLLHAIFYQLNARRCGKCAESVCNVVSDEGLHLRDICAICHLRFNESVDVIEI